MHLLGGYWEVVNPRKDCKYIHFAHHNHGLDPVNISIVSLRKITNFCLSDWLSQQKRNFHTMISTNNKHCISIMRGITSTRSSCRPRELFSVLRDSIMACFWISVSVSEWSLFSNSSWLDAFIVLVVNLNRHNDDISVANALFVWELLRSSLIVY